MNELKNIKIMTNLIHKQQKKNEMTKISMEMGKISLFSGSLSHLLLNNSLLSCLYHPSSDNFPIAPFLQTLFIELIKKPKLNFNLKTIFLQEFFALFHFWLWSY